MAQKQSWSDIPPTRRKLIVAAGVVQFSLLVAAQVDIRRRPADEVRGSKAMWRALSFVNFFGPLAYFTFGRRR